MSSTQEFGSVVQKIYDSLKDVSSKDRPRVVKSAMALFEEASPAQGGGGAHESEDRNVVARRTEPQSPTSYFNDKAPKSKSDVLAVGARYLEQKSGNQDGCSKEQLKKVITDAGKPFNDRTFSYDMNNAKSQARFFSKGGQRDSYQLSDYGRQHVDALPDRERASQLRGCSTSPRRKTGRNKGRAKA